MINRALVLLNLLNELRKRGKMLGKPPILSLFPNLFNKLKNPITTHARSSMLFLNAVCPGHKFQNAQNFGN